MDWTSEQDALLLKGLKEGLSASKIATRLKVTRNAVIGRKHRIQGTRFPCKARSQEEKRRLLKVRQAALDARLANRAKIIARMLGAIAMGKPRNASIVTARKRGATLEVIGSAVGLTYQRVQQIVEARNLGT